MPIRPRPRAETVSPSRLRCGSILEGFQTGRVANGGDRATRGTAPRGRPARDRAADRRAPGTCRVARPPAGRPGHRARPRQRRADLDAGRVRRLRGAAPRGARPPHRACRKPGALRGASRRQPPPPGLPRLRPDRRRRLRGRRRPLPRALRHRGLRGRRGRGDLLGPLPRLPVHDRGSRMSERKLTTRQGHPVYDNQNLRTIGDRGPATLENYHFLEKLSHFDRERVPERVVHARGATAFGHFEATGKVGDEPISKYTRAKLFQEAGKRTDVALRFSTVAGGRESSEWDLHVQLMEDHDHPELDWDPLDDTKVWPENDFPLRHVGTLQLNRIPENFFAESEQIAFGTGVLVDGLDFSDDKMLVGRTFSYSDTQRYRVGPNYLQLPVNQAKNARVRTNQRDGQMAYAVDAGEDQNPHVNYEPSQHNGLHESK